jgi:PKD repeat protein
VNEGSSITLTGSATDVPSDTLTYEWDLDNNGSFETSGQNPTFDATSLDGPTTVTVTLRVSDDGGGVTTDTTTISVDNVAPTADADGPYTVDEGDTVGLNGDGTDPVDTPLTYAWDLDNNGSFETSGQNPTFDATSLDGPTTVTVALRVSDDDGGVTTDTTTISVDNVAPTASATNDGPVDEGSPVTITADQTDAGSLDTFEYQFDCDNNGVYEIGWQTSSNAQCTFDDDTGGPFTVRVQVRDDDGGQSGPATTTVNVNNVTPSVDISDQSGDEGSPVSFSAIITDPGTADTFSYLWDFGDGVTSTLAGPDHTYADNDVYTVNLTVYDDDGGGPAEDQASVTVDNVAPVIDAGGPYIATPYEVITFTVTITDALGDSHTVEWDLDDNGSFETVGQTVTRTYTLGGDYQVLVAVTDDDGASTTDDAQVVISLHKIYLPIVVRSYQ